MWYKCHWILIWQDDIISNENYSEQACGYCKGTGKYEENDCPICKGKGNIMVAEPPTECPFCRGIAHAMKGIPCRRCKGTGWIKAKLNWFW